jgi:IMP dehydrogenase/GMP reductase
MKYDFDDIVIVPKNLTTINSRSEVNCYNEEGMLPIITSPMDTVINHDNSYHYSNNRINVCMPRCDSEFGVDYSSENFFISISLSDAENIALNGTNVEHYICIDMANGHMPKLRQVIELFKKNCPSIKLIVGNIANPDTYHDLALYGVWGVRVGIGAGAGCTTSANTGVHFPYASLIEECYKKKKQYNLTTKIISDGGTRKFSDIIKALALGADIVMIGSLLNKSLQSCSDPYLWKMFRIGNPKIAKWLFHNKFKLYKKYRGMSTKEVQKKWGNTTLKTAEGISKWNRVEYDLYKWCENLTDYMKSAMSYVDAKTLDEFKGCRVETITENAFKRFNK